MTSKDEQREALKAEAADAQGRGDRGRVLELLTDLAALDKPERAVQPKVTETRKTRKKG